MFKSVDRRAPNKQKWTGKGQSHQVPNSGKKEKKKSRNEQKIKVCNYVLSLYDYGQWLNWAGAHRSAAPPPQVHNTPYRSSARSPSTPNIAIPLELFLISWHIMRLISKTTQTPRLHGIIRQGFPQRFPAKAAALTTQGCRLN